MRTLLLTLIGLAVVHAASADDIAAMHHHPPPAGQPASAYAASVASAMDRMHGAMAAAPVNGDPAHDFLVQMIPHHEGAIAMARAVLAETRDPAVRNLAQSIVAEQANEIALMRSLLAERVAQPETSR